jgi:predicted transcriptional regulator
LIYDKYREKFQKNKDKVLDLRPYMMSELFTCDYRDKFDKVLLIFRFMHLRQLPVIDKRNGKIEGIITRQDLFAYMTL